jgi:predicted Zn-dependent protease
MDGSIKRGVGWAVVFQLLVLVFSCDTVPITGRTQVNLLPDTVLNSASFEAYRGFKAKNKPSTNPQKTELVKNVGSKIQRAVVRYFSQQGQSARLSGYEWEFTLIEDPTVNAFCMPGGKVVVYTGILPITETDEGLAVVLGHEIAHAVANHGNERVSQALITQAGGAVLSLGLSGTSEAVQGVVMQTYGVGTQVGVLLPYSRIHESEADRLGAIFMAMAGYDPRAAVGFWQRMAAQKKGKGTPEFLSTHPSDETRIRNIMAIMPEAMRYRGR